MSFHHTIMILSSLLKYEIKSNIILHVSSPYTISSTRCNAMFFSFNGLWPWTWTMAIIIISITMKRMFCFTLSTYIIIIYSTMMIISSGIMMVITMSSCFKWFFPLWMMMSMLIIIYMSFFISIFSLSTSVRRISTTTFRILIKLKLHRNSWKYD